MKLSIKYSDQVTDHCRTKEGENSNLQRDSVIPLNPFIDSKVEHKSKAWKIDQRNVTGCRTLKLDAILDVLFGWP